VESRDDALIYSTPVFSEPLTVAGKIRCRLYASSDRYDTDWSVRITDVYPDGRSILVTDNILMARHRRGFDRQDSLVPGQPDTFDIDVWSTAHVFNSGHRLRAVISSSNYPRFEKNPNTGAPFLRDDPVYLTARQKIYREIGLPSRLILPVIAIGNPVHEEPLSPRVGSDFPVISVPTVARILKIAYRTTRGQLTLSVFDATGRLIDRSRDPTPDGKNRTRVIPGLPSGVYFIRVCCRGQTRVYKTVVVD
jgi:hypothetical protein